MGLGNDISVDMRALGESRRHTSWTTVEVPNLDLCIFVDVAELLAFVDHELSTDFALLAVGQADTDHADVGDFASSVPGVLSLLCGTKFARIRIRLERWNEAPPVDLSAWEDRDELPFEATKGGGELFSFGFDEQIEPGLDLGSTTRFRVRIQASGRHRYGYEGPHDPDQEPQHEDWLVQFWPDPDHVGVLTGEPRRLAGPSPLELESTPWTAALHGWAVTGWTELLNCFPAFAGIAYGMSRAAGPADVETILKHGWAVGGPRDATLQTKVVARPGWDDEDELRALLASAAAMEQIDTIGDLVEAITRLELIALTAPSGNYVPNPAPQPAWDRLELPAVTKQRVLERALAEDYAATASGVMELLSWADGNVIHTTPIALATRMTVRLSKVIGAFELLDLTRAVAVNTQPTIERPDEELTVQQLKRTWSGSWL